MSGTPDTVRSIGGSVSGTVVVPGDKSISHRAAMIAALADGPSTLYGFLASEDCLATLSVLRACGVDIDRRQDGTVVVTGSGMRGLRTDPSDPLDFGNSGTGLRLMAGLLAGRGVNAVLTGDASLRGRPMARITEPLRRMGAAIADDGGRPPLTITAAPLQGADHRLLIASAQVKSCLLLAGLHAEGTTRIDAPASRDHTERMLAHYGVPLERDGSSLMVRRCDWDDVSGRSVRIPGDPSSGAFFAVAAAICPDSELRIPGVGINPGRTGFVEVLARMGAEVVVENASELDGEPCADLVIRGGGLSGTDIGADEVVSCIDELPALLIAAACADGTTRLTGAAELRMKESDRIRTMADGLRALGVTVEEHPDGLELEGRERLDGGIVDAAGDHRVAMAFAVAGLRADGAVTVRGCGGIATSYPGFLKATATIGMEVEAA